MKIYTPVHVHVRPSATVQEPVWVEPTETQVMDARAGGIAVSSGNRNKRLEAGIIMF
jgi:hypothetical protein